MPLVQGEHFVLSPLVGCNIHTLCYNLGHSVSGLLDSECVWVVLAQELTQDAVRLVKLEMGLRKVVRAKIERSQVVPDK